MQNIRLLRLCIPLRTRQSRQNRRARLCFCWAASCLTSRKWSAACSRKIVFVHLDLAEGIARDANGVQILSEIVRPDGVITTKNNLVRTIREYGMLAALRCFIMDGQSYQKAIQISGNVSPDFVELMPGILPPSLIESFCRETGAAVVAGGLVRSAVDANQAFSAGARGISTSDRSLWTLPIGQS